MFDQNRTASKASLTKNGAKNETSYGQKHFTKMARNNKNYGQKLKQTKKMTRNNKHMTRNSKQYGQTH